MYPQTLPTGVVAALLDPVDPISGGDPVIDAIRLLMLGFGYDFRNANNVARANDQLVRAKASNLLGDAARTLSRAEFAYRAEFCPPPSREQPFLPSSVTQPLKRLERTIRRLGDVETRIRSAEAPARDLIWNRFRTEAVLLQQLVALDVAFAVTATDVERAALAIRAKDLGGDALDAIDTRLDALENTLRDRAELLSIPTS